MHHSLVDSIDISLPKRVTGAPAFSPTIEAKYMESDRVSGRPSPSRSTFSHIVALRSHKLLFPIKQTSRRTNTEKVIEISLIVPLWGNSIVTATKKQANLKNYANAML